MKQEGTACAGTPVEKFARIVGKVGKTEQQRISAGDGLSAALLPHMHCSFLFVCAAAASCDARATLIDDCNEYHGPTGDSRASIASQVHYHLASVRLLTYLKWLLLCSVAGNNKTAFMPP